MKLRSILIVLAALTLIWFFLRSQEGNITAPIASESKDKLPFNKNSNHGIPPERSDSGPKQLIYMKPDSATELNEIGLKQSVPSGSEGVVESFQDGSNRFSEVFPGLEAYKWIFRNDHHLLSKLAPDQFRTKLGRLTKRDWAAYEGNLERLVDIKRGAFISFFSRDFFSDLVRKFRETSKTQFTFQNGVQIEEQSALSDSLPICVLTVNPTASTEPILKSFFITGVESPIENPDGWRGIKLSLSYDRVYKTEPWLTSIDCAVKDLPTALERYKALQLLHLLATIGIDGSLTN